MKRQGWRTRFAALAPLALVFLIAAGCGKSPDPKASGKPKASPGTCE